MDGMVVEEVSELLSENSFRLPPAQDGVRKQSSFDVSEPSEV
jgi:hypothetical protein